MYHVLYLCVVEEIQRKARWWKIYWLAISYVIIIIIIIVIIHTLVNLSNDNNTL